MWIIFIDHWSRGSASILKPHAIRHVYAPITFHAYKMALKILLKLKILCALKCECEYVLKNYINVSHTPIVLTCHSFIFSTKIVRRITVVFFS